jgi:uncharacterized protein
MKNSNTDPESFRQSRAVIAWAVLLFVLTIIGALPLILGGLSLNKLSSSSPPLVFGGIELTAYAPTLAALIIAGFFPEGGGVRSLLRQVAIWRLGIAWYGLALLGPIGLFLLANVMHILLGGAPPQQWLAFPSETKAGLSGVAFFIGSLLAGSLGEELGWRGFAQPRLQKLTGAVWASILIGVIWSTWHLWPAITPGGLSQLTPSDLAGTYIRLISLAVIYAWMYNSTNGSLFLIMVAHAGHNLASTLVQIPTDGTNQVPVIVTLLYLAAAIAAVKMAGPRTRSRPNSKK